MQKVAAYLLERRDGLEWPESRSEEAERLKAVVLSWLESKGASDAGLEGTFVPEDGSAGTYSTSQATADDLTSWTITLREDTAEGRRFATTISITSVPERVSVYITLEAGWATTQVMPVDVHPRCPRLVRSLLGLAGRWFHGSSQLNELRHVSDFAGGEEVAYDILNPHRTVPVLVLSELDGAVALPGLASKLARDLAGLANVCVLKDDATWALTDTLGAEWSCYWGAVRLFWPQYSRNQSRFSHPLWTCERLRSQPGNATEKFRTQLRGAVFRAAALSVIRPREIDQIRDAAKEHAISERSSHASSLEEYRELADSYAQDNDELRAERKGLKRQLEDLQKQVGRLESDRRALKAHLSASNAPVPSDAEEIAPDPVSEVGPPNAGEIRFYKKTYSTPSHDVLVRIGDCGCNNWEGAHSADKARKGIAKLEDGRSDWKRMQHCASCTGGGVWRVKW